METQTVIKFSEWEWLLFNANSANFQLYHEQVNFQWDDDEVCFVLDQHAEWDFYSASSLKQQSAGRHVAPLGNIIPISTQPVFALSPLCCLLNGEATNTNLIVFGLTRPRFELTIYRTIWLLIFTETICESLPLNLTLNSL